MSLKKFAIIVGFVGVALAGLYVVGIATAIPKGVSSSYMGTHVFLVRVGQALEQCCSQYGKFPTGDSRTAK